MGLKKWCVSDYDKELAKRLATECDIDPIVALIASSRGYTEPMELEQLLSDEPCFSDPRQIADMIKAADIVNSAVENREKIAIYGDYDCDGVTATALLYGYLRSRNADCIYYIPDRFEEGYGMNRRAIEFLKSKDVRLIVTVDNGISSAEEISLANSLGMTVVVTDHHLPKEELPVAAAVVDPHREDCPSEFKEICGAQVAFGLICVMESREPEELLPYYADILALAVTADVMPLILENRSIVKSGTEKLKASPSMGLSALMSVAGVDRKSMDSVKIAFTLAPRINAAGRMGKADRAVELLISDDMMTALSVANEIDSENTARQQCEKEIFDSAVEIIEKQRLMYDRVLVVCGEGWHHGVVGIAAARITEKYGCPTILFSSDGELAVGSGRSIEGFSLFDAISSVSDLTVRFGGHEQAAGLTVKAENIPELRRRINKYANRLEYTPPRLNLDCKLKPSALTIDLAFALKRLAPFGKGNAVPIFGIYGVTLQKITPIGGGKHLRLTFSREQSSFEALLFGVKPEDFCFDVGNILDTAVTVEPKLYKGEYSVSVQLKGIRMSGTDDTRLFREVSEFNAYMSGETVDTELILPTREQVGAVYKKICEKACSAEKLKYAFMNSIGYGKICIAAEVLEELNLITRNGNGFYCAAAGAEKTSLMNSHIFKELTERSESK